MKLTLSCLIAALVLVQTAPVHAAPPARPPVLLRRATLWTATGAVLPDSDILLQNGRIAGVGKDLSAPAGTQVIDARGRIATPGLVDMHSHLGVYAAPNSRAHADGNEMTAPATPYLRAIDSFDPEDAAIARAVAGGVTTSLILPGSGNVMGGQALYIKLFGRTVAEMQISGAPRAMKWALGENPKRTYGSRGQLPSSRMGSAWVIRQRLVEAQELDVSQQRWDKEAVHTAARPNRPDLEPLQALLRGEVLLQVHCYEVHDIETLVRLSEEFHFKVAAIHHALEAWKVPQLLREHRIAVATFADLWGFKLEAYDASVHAPEILQAAGVVVAMKTDHPVIEARDLVGEAAKAHHYGLAEQAALAAVTRNPAQAIGLLDRIGTLEVGKDADVVVWPTSPLKLGARPERVFVQGVQVVGDGQNLQAAWSRTVHATAGVCGCD
ncbi:MAG: amidohydrolase [Deltaproteobacteria bacterium]|nr:amidohydrolase [Deltaproteobacteria bacterium]